MKNIFRNLGLVGLLFAVMVTPGYAAKINGEISIVGSFVPVGGTGLADATGIDFLEYSGTTAISGTPGGNFFVLTDFTGDFTGYVSPFSVGTINDFSFATPFVPVEPLWTIGGFSFDLLTVTVVEQSAEVFQLSGTGKVYGNGFEATDGGWILTANTFGTTLTYSASAIAPVSEPMSLTLFGMSLLGLGAMIRRRREK